MISFSIAIVAFSLSLYLLALTAEKVLKIWQSIDRLVDYIVKEAKKP